jgi:hypothetical protein
MLPQPMSPKPYLTLLPPEEDGDYPQMTQIAQTGTGVTDFDICVIREMARRRCRRHGGPKGLAICGCFHL